MGRRTGRRILCAPVTRPKHAVVVCAAALVTLSAGCGREIEVSKSEGGVRDGAVIFNERCGGCHTLDAAGTRGSKPEGQAEGGERTNGPNFNTRKESKDDVLFAIRNGGFSGAIMPANIVVGEEAEKVADFVSKYAGQKAPKGAGAQ
jgi:mono/diheme cytochrome c family protein